MRSNDDECVPVPLDVGFTVSEDGFSSASTSLLKTFINEFPIGVTWDVISVDALDRKRKSLGPDQDFAFVVNLDRSHQSGSHFVAIYKKGQELFYLDPLKLNCFRWPDVPKFIRSFPDSRCWQLKKPVQDPKSWFCGYFALFYIYAIYNETAALDFIPLSTQALQLNNCRVLKNLGKVMNFYWEKKDRRFKNNV